MTFTFAERQLYTKAVIITILMSIGGAISYWFSVSSDDNIKMLAPFIFALFLILPIIIAFWKEKPLPLDKAIFKNCQHLTRDMSNRACQRCGIKVVWKGDEYRYYD